MQAAAAGHVEGTCSRAINFVFKVQDAVVVFGGLENYGTGSVAKQNAGGAVGVIQNRRHHISADHQHLLVRARENKLRAHLQGVEKRRARRGKIESPNPFYSELMLNYAR